MVSEFIRNRLDSAHSLIDEGSFEAAVNLLKNIKLRVHDEVVSDKISVFEKEHDNTLSKRVNDIRSSSKDSLRKQYEELDQYESYAKSYLSFYDRLSKEYDV